MQSSTPVEHIPLDQQTLVAVLTPTAAHYLSKADQTLRIWACRKDSPLKPIRINGRLYWRIADIRQLLGGATA